MLAALTAGPRPIASALLDLYAPWDSASLTTVRAYAMSCERLEPLQAADQGDEGSHGFHRKCGRTLRY